MSKPLISIYIPSIRPENWMTMYKSLSKVNEVSFELVFVGPVIPDYSVPTGVVCIYTTVKPAQCAEIGRRACEGEFCIFAQDDMAFSEHTLDRLYQKFMEINDDKVVVSCMPYLNGKPLEISRYRFWDSDRGSPLTPLCGLYKKSTIEMLGGIDKNFVCTEWDIDLVMRLYEIGGRTVHCEGTAANEYVPKGIERLCSYGQGVDRPTLHSLWVMTHEEYAREDKNTFMVHYINPGRIPGGVIRKNRLKPVESFSHEDILTISQGPKGKWA